MQAIRETASNIAASAISGMEKTKATVQEKMEIMAAQHPMEKQLATQKKEERIAQAERTKIATLRHNALLRQLSLSGAHNHSVGSKATVDRSQSLPARSATAEAAIKSARPALKMPASARSAVDGGTRSADLMAEAAATGSGRPEEAAERALAKEAPGA